MLPALICGINVRVEYSAHNLKIPSAGRLLIKDVDETSESRRMAFQPSGVSRNTWIRPSWRGSGKRYAACLALECVCGISLLELEEHRPARLVVRVGVPDG